MESNNIEEDENIDPETKEAKKELKELIEKKVIKTENKPIYIQNE